MESDPILRVEELHKHYLVGDKLVRALDGVDFELSRGETVAIIGESGSGKTTLGNLILGLERPTAGRILLYGQEVGARRSKNFRRRIQVVQQDPYSALNPSRTVQHSIELPLIVHGDSRRRERRDRVAELLRTVELLPDFMTRYPNTLSGGQRQRVALARALAAEPDVIVLDEPTSSLDVSVQAKVLALLLDLQKRMGLTYAFITHDLSVVHNIATRMVVLYRGKIVESGPTEAVFGAPRHRYTAMLLSSIPVITPEDEALKPTWPWEHMAPEEGGRQSAGCRFAVRCPYAKETCWNEVPPLSALRENPAHRFACHFPADVAVQA